MTYWVAPACLRLSRDHLHDRNVYATDNGAKMRAVYDLQGPQFETKVPQVGDIMGYRLTVQNSFDRTLRVSFALGLMRLVCTNGMQTMQKDVDMVSKHSQKLDLDSLITDDALDKASDSWPSRAMCTGDSLPLRLTRSRA